MKPAHLCPAGKECPTNDEGGAPTAQSDNQLLKFSLEMNLVGVSVFTGGRSLLVLEIYGRNNSYKGNRIGYLFLNSIYALQKVKGE